MNLEEDFNRLKAKYDLGEIFSQALIFTFENVERIYLDEIRGKSNKIRFDKIIRYVLNELSFLSDQIYICAVSGADQVSGLFAKEGIDTLKRLGIVVPDKKICFSQYNEDYECEFAYLFYEENKENIIKYVHGVIGAGLHINPSFKSEVDIYFIDLESKKIINIYDDRGMDIVDIELSKTVTERNFILEKQNYKFDDELDKFLLKYNLTEKFSMDFYEDLDEVERFYFDEVGGKSNKVRFNNLVSFILEELMFLSEQFYVCLVAKTSEDLETDFFPQESINVLERMGISISDENIYSSQLNKYDGFLDHFLLYKESKKNVKKYIQGILAFNLNLGPSFQKKIEEVYFIDLKSKKIIYILYYGSTMDIVDIG